MNINSLFFISVLISGVLLSLAIDWSLQDGLAVRSLQLLWSALIFCFISVLLYVCKRTDNKEVIHPVEEAEVLVAYGRKQEAIKILEDAIVKGGGDDVREKLIEIRTSK